MLRFLPAAAAVAIFPLLFGGIPQEAKAIAGLLLGGTFLLTSGESCSYQRQVFSRAALIAFVTLAIFQLVPLPLSLVQLICPERVDLHRWSTSGDTAPSSWLPLTLSTARTIERFWQLSLAFTAFYVARRAGASRRSLILFAWMITLSVATLGLADIWYRLHEHQSILGLWNTRWTKGAGTFQNRNLFAGWVSAGSMVGMGLILRYAAPLQGLRGSHNPAPSPQPGLAITVSCLLATGLAMAFATASRGALLAFASGICGLFLTLGRRSSSAKRFAGLFILFLVGTAALLYSSDRLITRLTYIGADATQPDRYGKLRIWEEAHRIQERFPWLGTGWGTFLTSFRLYKTAVPDSVAEHAENDYLETLSEIGIFGACVVAFLGVGCLMQLRKGLREECIREPEILIGALAALTSLTTHACFEFVFQNPSCLILGSTSLGLCLGALDARHVPSVPGPSASVPRMARAVWGTAIVIIATINLSSFTLHRTGLVAWESGNREVGRQAIEKGLRLWPWNVERQIVWIRAQAEGLRKEPRADWPRLSADILAQARRYQRYDPLDWELRYEMAWLALFFQPDPERGISEALKACRANPMQHRIPLAFARHFRDDRPETAFQFLKLVPPGVGTKHSLDLALEAEFDPMWLWQITPSNDPGMWELASAALSHGKPRLAKQAISRLHSPPQPLKLASFYLQHQASDEVTQLLLENTPNSLEKLLLAEAWINLSNYRKSIELSSAIWRTTDKTTTAGLPPAGQAMNKTSDGLSAQDLAFIDLVDSSTASAEELQRLEALAVRHPENRRASELLFDHAVLKGDLGRAAEISLRVAKVYQVQTK